jgi:hypothetical protein
MCESNLANGPLNRMRIDARNSSLVYQSHSGSLVPDGHADGGRG